MGVTHVYNFFFWSNSNIPFQRYVYFSAYGVRKQCCWHDEKKKRSHILYSSKQFQSNWAFFFFLCNFIVITRSNLVFGHIHSRGKWTSTVRAYKTENRPLLFTYDTTVILSCSVLIIYVEWSVYRARERSTGCISNDLAIL